MKNDIWIKKEKIIDLLWESREDVKSTQAVSLRNDFSLS